MNYVHNQALSAINIAVEILHEILSSTFTMKCTGYAIFSFVSLYLRSYKMRRGGKTLR